MSSDVISVITVQEITGDEQKIEAPGWRKKYALKDILEALGISVFGIIGFSLLFTVPWTSIPRTNSIIYQSHWMEVLLPHALTVLLLGAGTQFLELTIWTDEKTMMSISNFLKVYAMWLIPYNLLYVSVYALWSVNLQYNHPLPNLGLIIFALIIIVTIGMWFIPPSNLLAIDDFRQKMKSLTIYYLWLLVTLVLKEILSILYTDFLGGFQFLSAFIVAGIRELDRKVRSKQVTRMMGVQDDEGAALLTTCIGAEWASFIAIRLVGANFATLCFSVAIDFALHLKMTVQIIKECRKVNSATTMNSVINTNITTLIVAELIDGFTPIIYGISILMALYGPNSTLFSNIGNDYWSKEIEDLGPLFVTMSMLLGVDFLGVLINFFCIWKLANVNMMSEVVRVLNKYWYFMTVQLSALMAFYFAGTDINFGNDQTLSFKWISNEGWINMVNTSTVLTNEEKDELLSNITLY